MADAAAAHASYTAGAGEMAGLLAVASKGVEVADNHRLLPLDNPLG
jgi:hypothetical protein